MLQRSILGPLLFLLYISDIICSSNTLNYYQELSKVSDCMSKYLWILRKSIMNLHIKIWITPIPIVDSKTRVDKTKSSNYNWSYHINHILAKWTMCGTLYQTRAKLSMRAQKLIYHSHIDPQLLAFAQYLVASRMLN